MPANNRTIVYDMEKLRSLLHFRIEHSTKSQDKPVKKSPVLSFAKPNAGQSAYDDFLLKFKPDIFERVILLLALIPHLQANFFESVILNIFPGGGDLPEIGGAKGSSHRGMMPTGETAAYLLAEDPAQGKSDIRNILNKDHFFLTEDILYLEVVKSGEPKLSGRILLSEDYADYFMTGTFGKPDFGSNFPAKLITTNMTWDDLVLHSFTEEQIADMKRWLQFHHTLEKDANLSRKISLGYKALFYGPPGTGKTLTATITGKEFGREVYRIDLSQIVSKYIGETEKNLEKVFNRAENKEWILFFDEADAVFGKRTTVRDAHDKYANQETAYLLQRIEDFSGLLILASNFKSNIDDAFLRRFHAIVHFPMPNAQERHKLWKQSLPASIRYNELPLHQLATEHEISGAAIINIMQHACLKALAREDNTLTANDLLEGIRREKRKEGG